jgi:phage terminase small subunit
VTPATRQRRAPSHLRAATRRWWETVVTEYELEAHHVRLLTLAGETWDRGEQARNGIAEHGLTYTDRFGSPKPRPEVAIERDAKIVFARLLRELALDVDPPAESRPRPIGA